MSLKIQIVRNDRVLLEAPLWPSVDEESCSQIVSSELRGLDEELLTLTDLFETLANETRLRMLAEMVEESRRFSDFMHGMHLNPKIVSENLSKMLRQNLIQKRERKGYAISPLGLGSLLTMCVVLKRIRRELQKERRW